MHNSTNHLILGIYLNDEVVALMIMPDDPIRVAMQLAYGDDYEFREFEYTGSLGV